MKLLDVLNKTTKWFEDKGLPEARLSAQHILAHVLKMNRMDLYVNFDRPLTDEELASARELVARRAAREPLQHVLGRAWFRNLELKADRRALIPRQETEQLVDWALELFKTSVTGKPEAAAETATDADADADAEESSLTDNADSNQTQNIRILELGVGSGAISLALAQELHPEFILGVDASADALSQAQENAELNKISAVEWRQSDWYAEVSESDFDLIISNPPYIAHEVLPSLEIEVREFDPLQALIGKGDDGLGDILSILHGAAEKLRIGGLVLLEIGYDQGGVLKNTPVPALEFVELRRDFQGNDRMVLFRRI